MHNTTLIILVLVVLLLAGIIIVLLVRKSSSDNKWKCVEGKCEQDINGDYTSKASCQEVCQAKTDMMRMQQALQSQQNQQMNAMNAMNAWACNSNYQCIPASQGFTSKELCEQNCQVPVSNAYYPYIDYGYYYPQSLWYRPWYWGSSWGGWGGRGRGGRGRGGKK